jgi:hypothetical protein
MIAKLTSLPRTLRLAAFWGALAFSYGAAIMPGDAAPTLGESDKTDHIAAFLTLTVLARIAWPDARRWTVLAALSAYGA